MTFGDHIGYITSQNELEMNWHVLASGEVLAFRGFCCFLSFVIKLFALEWDWYWQRVNFLYAVCIFFFMSQILKIYHSDTKVNKTTWLMLVSLYLLQSTELRSAPPNLTLKPEFQGKLHFQRRTQIKCGTSHRKASNVLKTAVHKVHLTLVDAE